MLGLEDTDSEGLWGEMGSAVAGERDSLQE